MNAKQKLALIGGTFDPVHYGHLIAAEHARVELGIDKAVFIPTARPPHKTDRLVTAWKHRLGMLKLATRDNPAFEISSLEGPQRGTAYTIDTLRSLRAANPQSTMYYMIGADALLAIDTWKDYQQLTSLCYLVVVTRPNYVIERNHPVLAALPEAWWRRLKQIGIPSMDISSTDIRHRVAHGKTIRYLLPDAVEQYIYQNNLYRGGI